jgi:hypothetical protein
MNQELKRVYDTLVAARDNENIELVPNDYFSPLGDGKFQMCVVGALAFAIIGPGMNLLSLPDPGYHHFVAREYGIDLDFTSELEDIFMYEGGIKEVLEYVSEMSVIS